MNALAKQEVGDYLNTHFVSSFQRVGTFKVRGNNKQGGNVASYFCTPQGRILHAIAGPVNSTVLLREARWVVETWKLASLEGGAETGQLQGLFRKAHLERLRRDHRVNVGRLQLPAFAAADDTALIDEDVVKKPQGHRRNLNNSAKVHKLLATYPLVRLSRVYALVFEEILNEDITTRPVVTRR